jgi:hypothetical protein
MDETNGLKQYHLSPEALETLLQTESGNDIKPVNHHLLQKQRINQQRQAAMQIRFKDKRVKPAQEPRDEELKEIEESEEIESL